MIEKYFEKIAGDEKFFLGEDIPKKKLKGAIDSYAGGCEDPLMLYDDTVFGSAKDGFLLNNEFFSCKTKNLEKFKINLIDINSIDFKKSIFSADIYINGKKVAECIQAKKESIQYFIELLKILVEELKNSNDEDVQAEDIKAESETTKNFSGKEPFDRARTCAVYGEIFATGIEEPATDDEVLDGIRRCIENGNIEDAKKLIIFFAENRQEPLRLIRHNEGIRDFVVSFCEELDDASEDTPGYFIIFIFRYFTLILSWEKLENFEELLNNVTEGFKIGTKKGHPASPFYLAKIIENYPHIAEKNEIEMDCETLYAIAATRKHPLAVRYYAHKYLHIYTDKKDTCLVSCDYVPSRSWPLFRARALLQAVIASFKTEQHL